MKVHIELLDDNNDVLAEYTGDASQPGGWRATSTQRLIAAMPRQSDNINTGTYELFGFTYQPHVHVERPNGYQAPQQQNQSPNNGQSPVSPFPSSFPSHLLPKRGPLSPPAQSQTGLPVPSRLPASDTKLRG